MDYFLRLLLKGAGILLFLLHPLRKHVVHLIEMNTEIHMQLSTMTVIRVGFQLEKISTTRGAALLH